MATVQACTANRDLDDVLTGGVLRLRTGSAEGSSCCERHQTLWARSFKGRPAHRHAQSHTHAVTHMQTRLTPTLFPVSVFNTRSLSYPNGVSFPRWRARTDSSRPTTVATSTPNSRPTHMWLRWPWSWTGGSTEVQDREHSSDHQKPAYLRWAEPSPGCTRVHNLRWYTQTLGRRN